MKGELNGNKNLRDEQRQKVMVAEKIRKRVLRKKRAAKIVPEKAEQAQAAQGQVPGVVKKNLEAAEPQCDADMSDAVHVYDAEEQEGEAKGPE